MKMNEHLKAFVRHLTEKEKSKSTIESYTRYVSGFLKYMDGNEITKELVIQYREHLESRNLVHTTINLMLVSINCYLEYVQKPECRVKLLKIQKRNYVDTRMKEEEYEQLLTYALTHNEKKYYLIMSVLGTTGIRIQELSMFTVKALSKNNGNIEIRNKNKTRTVPIPAHLKNELLCYARENNITTGAVFLGSRGTPITREAVWKKLKKIAEEAGIDADKIYPHAFRHFFAFLYIKEYHNVCTLADILGHSRVETTRIYLQQTLDDTRNQIDSMYAAHNRHIRELQKRAGHHNFIPSKNLSIVTPKICERARSSDTLIL